jgi:hypothetical protein
MANFTPPPPQRERCYVSHWTGGWMGLRPCLGAAEKSEISLGSAYLNHDCSVAQYVASLYTD